MWTIIIIALFLVYLFLSLKTVRENEMGAVITFGTIGKKVGSVYIENDPENEWEDVFYH